MVRFSARAGQRNRTILPHSLGPYLISVPDVKLVGWNWFLGSWVRSRLLGGRIGVVCWECDWGRGLMVDMRYKSEYHTGPDSRLDSYLYQRRVNDMNGRYSAHVL